MLDTVVFKGDRFLRCGILDVSTHVKTLNKFLYVPFRSCHDRRWLKAFIRAELLRLVRTNSSFLTFSLKRAAFWSNLRARGYHPRFLTPLFLSITYSARDKALQTSMSLLSRQTAMQPPTVFKTRVDAPQSFGAVHCGDVLNRTIPNSVAVLLAPNPGPGAGPNPRVVPATTPSELSSSSAKHDITLCRTRSPNLQNLLVRAQFSSVEGHQP
jgi:hypothetical protein